MAIEYLYLVQHGESKPEQEDPERPLTEKGRKDVEVIEVGFDYVGLLTRNEIDAMQCNIMVEPLEMEALGYELNVIKGYELGYEAYSQVLVTTEKLINNSPGVLSRFLKVTFNGWRKAYENPQEVAEIIVSNYLREGSSELQKQMLLSMRPIIEGKVGLDRLGMMEAKRWQTSINYLVQNDMIQKSLAAEEVMTNQFL